MIQNPNPTRVSKLRPGSFLPDPACDYLAIACDVGIDGAWAVFLRRYRSTLASACRRGSAAGWETGRIVTTRPAGLFGRMRRQSIDSEDWEGYCSGFTASTIRHPEPMRAVDAKKVGGRAYRIGGEDDLGRLRLSQQPSEPKPWTRGAYFDGYSNLRPSASPASSKMGLSTSLISSRPASISGE